MKEHMVIAMKVALVGHLSLDTTFLANEGQAHLKGKVWESSPSKEKLKSKVI